MKHLFLIALFLVSSIQAAEEIVWVQVLGLFTYKDMNHTCSSISMYNASKVYLSALVEEDLTVKEAYINSTAGAELGNKQIKFSDGSLADIELVRAVNGTIWIAQLPLNEAMLRALSFSPRQFSYSCHPVKALKTITPNSVLFQFDTAKLAEKGEVSRTTTTSFSGLTAADAPWQATLQLEQQDAHARE